LPHDHELRQSLPERPLTGQGHCGTEETDGRATRLMNWNFLHRAPSAAKEPAVRDILDHMGFPIADYGRSVTFYKNALAPLGITLLKEFKLSEDGADGYAGFGRER